jgi:hypothetical protein
MQFGDGWSSPVGSVTVSQGVWNVEENYACLPEALPCFQCICDTGPLKRIVWLFTTLRDFR